MDTSVVSKLTKDTPDSQVIEFLATHDDLWLSSIMIHELEYGLHLLPAGHRRDRLTAMISGIVSAYADRILSLDRTGAEWAARLRAYARRSGYSIDLGHVLIAGIARANNLAIATRNVSDFRALGVLIIDPARFRGVGRFCCRCGGHVTRIPWAA